jgi:hypothetical protein
MSNESKILFKSGVPKAHRGECRQTPDWAIGAKWFRLVVVHKAVALLHLSNLEMSLLVANGVFSMVYYQSIARFAA